jgi:hypothetical protein
MDINQKDMPTKSLGCNTLEDAQTGVLVSPKTKQVPRAIFTLDQMELNFMFSPQ